MTPELECDPSVIELLSMTSNTCPGWSWVGCGWTQPCLVQHAPPASAPCQYSRLFEKFFVGEEGKFKTVLSNEGYVSSRVPKVETMSFSTSKFNCFT